MAMPRFVLVRELVSKFVLDALIRNSIVSYGVEWRVSWFLWSCGIRTVCHTRKESLASRDDILFKERVLPSFWRNVLMDQVRCGREWSNSSIRSLPSLGLIEEADPLVSMACSLEQRGDIWPWLVIRGQAIRISEDPWFRELPILMDTSIFNAIGIIPSGVVSHLSCAGTVGSENF